jgi:hypothetical protein
VRIVVKVIFGILIVGILAYLGSCVYANFFAPDSSTTSNYPDMDKAKYSVYIKNTGNLLFTDSYEIHGKTNILHGFWELSGKKYQYRKTDLVLDEAIFGVIEIKQRTKK